MTRVGAASPASDTLAAPSARRAVLAGGIGNFIEWFDYGVYAALSPVIASLFFPGGNSVAATLSTFAVFGVGFVVRPLGGLFFGQLGDRRGRRTALGLALILISLSTACMGLLPTFASAGVAAPLLLLLLRLIQGFSAGGEFTGSATMMVENAQTGRRGWISSWQQFSVITGTLAGVLIVTAITDLGSSDLLESWGWRIPFLVALPLGAVGFYIRFRMEDTPHFEALRSTGDVAEKPTREAVRTQRRAMVIAFFYTALPNIGFYTFLTYTPTFLRNEAGLSLGKAYLVNVVGTVLYALFTLVVGRLSDRFGRRPILITHAVAFFVSAIPIYLLLSSGSFLVALVVQLPAMLIMSCYSGPGTAGITELFPTRLRYSAMALPYNLSSAIFGGTAPFIATALIAWLGTPIAPAFWAMLAAIPTFVVYVRMRETAFSELQDR
ncbi:MFS transporter [Amycolatopsis sp. OK19-0408]|uniref:Putative proline/betaine transporter n=1 Tax=Amycolatopsis iheyensis TaxID=2945988 RepID=A0A9X2NCJ2_9PSEU|nr:MFS transporter [Amycolatopsis iheyensis]MCR6485128.1 MFS transporter [Amycolatopsis iheyensis]